jgi:ATP-binding cassette, subfamily B, heavy metal transporter
MASHSRPAAAASGADADAIESSDAGLGPSLARITRILARRELAKWRPLMALALVLTLVSKALAVVAPVFFGDAINALSGPDAVLAAVMLLLLWWTLARILSANLPYLRDAIFAPISQDAQRLVAVDAFGHAQSLSLGFHQTRRTGALNRVIDRGVQALDFLIRFLGFNIGPTLIELALAAIVLSTRYSPLAALVAVITVAVYAAFTFLVTNWRTVQRRRMNEADTELRARAVDTMANFETVKAFAAETRETQRYDASMRRYNVEAVKVSQSMALLNAGQDVIMALGLTAVITAFATFDGRVQPGDMAAVVLIMTNLYRPLNILGWAFREIKQGAVDLEKLYGLMGMKPEVADAPDARPFRPAGGRQGRHRRPVRLGQVDAPQAPVPVLRRGWRSRDGRRAGCPLGHPAIPARRHRPRPAGGRAVQLHHPREHRLRRARCERGRSPRRRAPGAAPRLHRRPAEWLGHPRRRAGNEALGRGEAARRHRARDPQEPRHPRARRGDLGAR